MAEPRLSMTMVSRSQDYDEMDLDFLDCEDPLDPMLVDTSSSAGPSESRSVATDPPSVATYPPSVATEPPSVATDPPYDMEDEHYEDAQPRRSSRQSIKRYDDEELFDDKEELPHNHNERKFLLRRKSWNYFVGRYTYTKPLTRPPEHHMYCPKMVFDESKIESSLEPNFVDFSKLYLAYYARDQGRTLPKANRDISLNKPIPLQLDIDEIIWPLFVGLDPEDVVHVIRSRDTSSLNYKQVDLLIEYFQHHPNIKAVHDFREEQRRQYVGDKAWRLLEAEDVNWLVHRDIPLPWVVPVSIYWHNSRAVPPAKASILEMMQCGRLTGANDRIYNASLLYKAMIPRGIELEALLVHVKGSDETVWDVFNEGEKFFWYTPVYRLYVWPDPDVGMSMMMGFLKSDIDSSHPDTIFVPDKSVVHSLVGELRPADLSVEDGYGFSAINDYEDVGETAGKKTASANIIATNYMGYYDRPGVGNAGYMANCTCGVGLREHMSRYKGKELRTNEFFKLSESRLGNKQNNGIENATYIYKHAVIKAAQNITGRTIKTWH